MKIIYTLLCSLMCLSAHGAIAQVLHHNTLSPAAENHDTPIRVWQRHLTDWQGAVVVMDWTESMYPYREGLVEWLRYHHTVFGAWVFFNDGDGRVLGEKVIGDTGGFHTTTTREWQSIVHTMAEAARLGSGDEAEENDIEALYFARRSFPQASRLVLVADAESHIRDLLLLPPLAAELRRDRVQVHIVLCGQREYRAFGDYLYVAQTLGASLHTLEADYPNLAQPTTHTEIQIGTRRFVFKRGRWQRQTD